MYMGHLQNLLFGTIYCCITHFIDRTCRMKNVFFIIVLLIFIFTTFHVYERHRFRDWFKKGHQKIKNFGGKGNSVNIETLPPILQSYLEKVILQMPSGGHVHFTQVGDFRLKPEDKMSKFKSDQFVSVTSPMFSWVADIKMNGLPVIVCDRLIDGRGELQVRLLSSIPLAEGSGEIFLRGELLRYLAELPWYPMAILNQQDIVWDQTEDKKVTGSISMNSVSATVEYTFSEENLIQSIFVPDREKSDGKTVDLKPWIGEFAQYEEREGVLIPIQGQVSWLLDSGKFTYFIGNMTSYKVSMNTSFHLNGAFAKRTLPPERLY